MLLTRTLTVSVVTIALFGAQTAPLAAERPAPIRIGAVFPLKGATSSLARQEYLGVEIARDVVNKAGGVNGHRIILDQRDLEDPLAAPAVTDALRAKHDSIVLGAYSSALSIPASAAAYEDGLTYWEAGAVADRLTGRGLPGVFRVGASGSNLGRNSARFAATQLAARLHKRPHDLRVFVVSAEDDYAQSVAQSAMSESKIQGMSVVGQSHYDALDARWAPVMKSIKGAHPDILILASHVPDGVAFRRAMLAAHLHVGAFIGSTMAECGPDFGRMLGRDAVGVFASDRPMGGFNPRALHSVGAALYRRFAAAWYQRTGLRQPTEEALAGFSAAWPLFHAVLPGALRSSSLTRSGIIKAAMQANLPTGSLPNGAGLRFAADKQHLGQNMRASAVIWQWQAVRHSVVVWPKVYATGKIEMVPLSR
jgi:ABC-type branched-subunit amino acid transport system substrate-binding protein